MAVGQRSRSCRASRDQETSCVRPFATTALSIAINQPRKALSRLCNRMNVACGVPPQPDIVHVHINLLLTLLFASSSLTRVANELIELGMVIRRIQMECGIRVRSRRDVQRCSLVLQRILGYRLIINGVITGFG